MPGFRKKIGSGRREHQKNLSINHTYFFGHASCKKKKKKGGEYIFERILGNDRIRERQNEGTTERGNDWNDTTSIRFKNLVNCVGQNPSHFFGPKFPGKTQQKKSFFLEYVVKVEYLSILNGLSFSLEANLYNDCSQDYETRLVN
jgi:hypothetical protein